MRLVAGLLACAVNLALADEPPAASASAPAAPAASAPAATAPPASAAHAAAAAAAASTPTAIDPDERALLSQGYKPRIRHGERVFCKRETALGSRVDAVERCGTVAQLRTRTLASREITEQSQRVQLNPTGR